MNYSIKIDWVQDNGIAIAYDGIDEITDDRIIDIDIEPVSISSDDLLQQSGRKAKVSLAPESYINIPALFTINGFISNQGEVALYPSNPAYLRLIFNIYQDGVCIYIGMMQLTNYKLDEDRGVETILLHDAMDMMITTAKNDTAELTQYSVTTGTLPSFISNVIIGTALPDKMRQSVSAYLMPTNLLVNDIQLNRDKYSYLRWIDDVLRTTGYPGWLETTNPPDGWLPSTLDNLREFVHIWSIPASGSFPNRIRCSKFWYWWSGQANPLNPIYYGGIHITIDVSNLFQAISSDYITGTTTQAVIGNAIYQNGLYPIATNAHVNITNFDIDSSQHIDHISDGLPAFTGFEPNGWFYVSAFYRPEKVAYFTETGSIKKIDILRSAFRILGISAYSTVIASESYANGVYTSIRLECTFRSFPFEIASHSIDNDHITDIDHSGTYMDIEKVTTLPEAVIGRDAFTQVLKALYTDLLKKLKFYLRFKASANYQGTGSQPMRTIAPLDVLMIIGYGRCLILSVSEPDEGNMIELTAAGVF